VDGLAYPLHRPMVYGRQMSFLLGAAPLSHLKIPVLECEPLFLNKFKFSKVFDLIQVKMILF
jgi:hypothetical protein